MSKQTELIKNYFHYVNIANSSITAIEEDKDITFIFVHFKNSAGYDMLYCKPKFPILEILFFTSNTRIIFTKIK